MSRAVWACANVVVDAWRRAGAVYELPLSAYAQQPLHDKLALFDSVLQLTRTIGTPFTLHRIATRANRAEALLKSALEDESALAQLSALRTRVLLVATLDRAPTTLLSRVRARVTSLRLACPLAQLQAAGEAEQQLFSRLQGAIGVERIPGVAAAQLLGMQMTGIATQDAQLRCDLLLPATGVGVPHQPRMLRAGDGSYSAVLVLGRLSESLLHPGSELLVAPLEALGFAVSVAASCEWLGNERALRLAGRQLLDADNEVSELALAGRDVGYGPHERRELARRFKAYLTQAARPPMLRACITLRTSAASPAELAQQVAQLRAAYAPLAVHWPAYTQARLHSQHALRVPDEAQRRGQLLTCEEFAALTPTASELAGDQRGALLGHLTRSRRPVLLDVRAAPAAARPPTILCTGTLGSGKTLAAQLIATHALRAGSLVIDVDPKPDHQLHTLPGAHTRRVIDLADTQANVGTLDPLRIAPPALREELALGLYRDLVDEPDAVMAELRRAIQHAASQPQPSSEHMLTMLEASSSQRARRAAAQLRAAARSGLARLVFSQPKGEARAAGPAAQLTSMRLGGLVLPEPSVSRCEWSPAERTSVQIVRLVAAAAMRQALTSGAGHKLVLLDEAWVLLLCSEGRALVERMVRMGRSQNVTVLLATQQICDIGELVSLVGTHLAFGCDSLSEAQAVLASLGLAGDEALARRLLRFRTGRCLLRDIHARIGELQIDIPHELHTHLDTTPTTQGAA